MIMGVKIGIVVICIVTFGLAIFLAIRHNSMAGTIIGIAGIFLTIVLGLPPLFGWPPDPTDPPSSPPFETETPTPTPDRITLSGASYELPFGSAPSSADLDKVGKHISYPTGYYLDEYQKMYITASKKHSVYAYPNTEGDKSGTTWLILHGTEVIVLGKMKEFGCVIWWNSKSEAYMAGWVYWNELSSTMPD